MLDAIPESTKQSLKEYIERGVPVGSFLHAVLSNDLANAVFKADRSNRLVLPDIMYWIHENAPDASWGSEAKVIRWIQEHPERTKTIKLT
jgi:hypothetical protein